MARTAPAYTAHRYIGLRYSGDRCSMRRYGRHAGPVGRSVAAGAGQPGRRAEARLRHHAGRGADHGRAAQRGHAVRGDRPAGGARVHRSIALRRPETAVPHHRGRCRRTGPPVRADEPGRIPGHRTPPGQPQVGSIMSSNMSRATRLALALYPPSWRARYAAEVHALVEQNKNSRRDVASLAWRALPAWIWPPAHLHDRPARMRASLSTGLLAWSFLTGLGLVFAQLTQFQGFRPAAHPIIGVCYLVFDVALALSIAAAGLGGLPLWLLMIRRAHREHRRRDVAALLLPLIAPAAFLAGLRVTVRLAGGADGVSPWWFLVLTLAGFAAATAAAAGPGLALRRLQPRGPALRLAAIAGGVAGRP